MTSEQRVNRALFAVKAHEGTVVFSAFMELLEAAEVEALFAMRESEGNESTEHKGLSKGLSNLRADLLRDVSEYQEQE